MFCRRILDSCSKWQINKYIDSYKTNKKKQQQQAALKLLSFHPDACVCVRERVCLRLFPNESLIVIPAPWNFDQWEDSFTRTLTIVVRLKTLPCESKPQPRIKSNIVIIVIPVSE